MLCDVDPDVSSGVTVFADMLSLRLSLGWDECCVSELKAREGDGAS